MEVVNPEFAEHDAVDMNGALVHASEYIKATFAHKRMKRKHIERGVGETEPSSGGLRGMNYCRMCLAE
jgi:hypothetical protein